MFAREAETANPWTPAGMLCDTACSQLTRGIYDTLVYADEDREPHPFLLESFTPNATFDEWTFVAREGVTFHDGTPFDADALVDNLERIRRSPVGATSLPPSPTSEGRRHDGGDQPDDPWVASRAVRWPARLHGLADLAGGGGRRRGRGHRAGGHRAVRVRRVPPG